MTIEGSKVRYTTNAIESLNSGFRRLNRGRTIFPNAMAHTKALYLATWDLTKKMDHACSQLGTGLCGAGHHVPRQADPELAVCRIGTEVVRSIDASLDRTPGKYYAFFTDGDGNHRLYRTPVGHPF